MRWMKHAAQWINSLVKPGALLTERDPRSVRALRRALGAPVALAVITCMVFGAVVSAGFLLREESGPRILHAVPRPAIIAHRGDSACAENSLHAIAQAGAHHADYAEIDIRLTRDGVPVVFHDTRTGRLSAAGVNVPVRDLSLSELQRMPMRSRGQYYHVPTLLQAMRQAERTPDHLGLLLDLKTGDRGARALTAAVMREVAQARFRNKLMVMAVNARAADMLHVARPQWKVGRCLSGIPQKVNWREHMDFVVLRYHDVSPAFMMQARKHHVPLYIGAVSDARQVDWCVREGVVGMLSEDTRVVRSAVDAYVNGGMARA